MVSHDRDLMDRLCTEVVGLDGRGGASLYGSVNQWLTAYEKEDNAAKNMATGFKSEGSGKPAKSRKLNFREQQELEKMEATILTAEGEVAQREAAVESASVGGHLAMTDACKALEKAQKNVEKLYARWAELEAKRAG